MMPQYVVDETTGRIAGAGRFRTKYQSQMLRYSRPNIIGRAKKRLRQTGGYKGVEATCNDGCGS
jgi:hypothetical protein